MEQIQPASRRTLAFGLGAVVILILVVGTVAFLLFGATKRDTSDVSNTPGGTSTAKEKVEKNLTDANAAVKQADSDQGAAATALEDDKNQTEVNN